MKQITILKNGVTHIFSGNTRNKKFYSEKFSSWEPEMFLLFEKFKDSKGVAIDIGAWVGTTSIWLSKNFKKVVAVEADNESIKELSDNLKFSNCNNVSICTRPISDITEDVIFGAKDGKLNTSESRIKHTKSDNDYVVKSITFNELLSQYCNIEDNITFIKCDIEGGEERILKDILLFANSNNIPVLLSFHLPWFVDQDLTKFNNVFELYRNRIYTENITPVNNVVEFINNHKFISLLFSPNALSE